MEMMVRQTVRQAAADLVAALDACAARLAAGESEAASYAAVAAALDGCLAELRSLGLWGPDNRLPSSELWNAAGHYLQRGWLQNRARTKPRGYAGDYEMLARMHASELCDDPLGRAFDRYFQEEAAPRAVRGRMKLMAEWIVEAASAGHPHPGLLPEGEGEGGPLQVAVFGSAFGLEVRDALLRMDAAARRRLRVVLLDLDPAAVQFARGQLLPLIAPEQLTATAANLFRVPERPRLGAPLAGSQLIFCPGLFDYLDDDAARAMLQALYGQLAPGGELFVFQFAPHSTTRAYMEWLGNWYLIYRDAEQFRRLVLSAGFEASQLQFGAEESGVDLFARIRRE